MRQVDPRVDDGHGLPGAGRLHRARADRSHPPLGRHERVAGAEVRGGPNEAVRLDEICERGHA